MTLVHARVPLKPGFHQRMSIYKHMHKDIRKRRMAHLTQFSIPALLNPMISKIADKASFILPLICSHGVWVKVAYDWSTALCLCRPSFYQSKLRHKHKHKHKKNELVRFSCAYAYLDLVFTCLHMCLCLCLWASENRALVLRKSRTRSRLVWEPKGLFVRGLHSLHFPSIYSVFAYSFFFFVSLCYFFQIQQYSRNMDELKSQLGLSQDKLHRQAQDATRRDEQLVVLKVELATLQEKHRLIQEEVFVKCLIWLFSLLHFSNSLTQSTFSV